MGTRLTEFSNNPNRVVVGLVPECPICLTEDAILLPKIPLTPSIR